MYLLSSSIARGIGTAPTSQPPPEGDGNYPVAWESSFNYETQDVNGFSVMTPSSDSRLIYVSAAGDDGTAQSYIPADAEIGADYLNPVGPIDAYLTVGAALAESRNLFPDYILFNRGDEWTYETTITPREGRSVTEKSVMGTYGATVARPVIKTGVTQALTYNPDTPNCAILGLKFYASKRDPNHGDFVGYPSAGVPYGFFGFINALPLSGVLIEDVYFDHYYECAMIAQDPLNPMTDIIVRRNIISHCYSNTSSERAQGFFGSRLGVLFEENLVDHDGWLIQTNGTNDDEGGATLFNHGLYVTECDEAIFRKNIISRSSSIGIKLTADAVVTNTIKAKKVLIDNNYVVEGEIGFSAGGNQDFNDGARWEDMFIVNNVVQHVGRTEPTDRGLGWGITINDWQTGLVEGNILSEWGSAAVSNVFGVRSNGHNTDVIYNDNKFSNIVGNGGDWLFTNENISDQSSNTVTNNHFIQNTGTDARLVNFEDGVTGAGFTGNTYFSDATDSGATSWFEINAADQTHTQWVSATSETGSSTTLPAYTDASRTIETYMTSIGETATLVAFVAKAEAQSRLNWDVKYTADTVNDYIREGFEV